MTAEAWVALGGAALGLAVNLTMIGVMYGRLMGRLNLIEYRLFQVEKRLGIEVTDFPLTRGVVRQ